MPTQDYPSRRKPSTQFPLIRLVLLLIFCIVVCGSVLMWKKQDARTAACNANLHAIYAALQRYEVENGQLPEMALFPDDATESIDSLLNVLRPFGITESTCICPALPESLRKFGITYLWNATKNGSRLSDLSSNTWLLVEINALRPRVPTPHREGYQILYADGRVETSTRPPGEL